MSEVKHDVREALAMMIRCAYPVSTDIDSRGYQWSEAWLDDVLPIARAALSHPVPDVPEPTFPDIEPWQVTFGPGRKAPGVEEVEAIRARHEAALARMADNNWPVSEGRQDVATLLALVDQMRVAQ